ncbi:MAG: hypothetical protein E7464_01450 [Ruminococcaceae bacterium]|nr:hypothetical protein [Oscillospiraceae bacterium]
MQRALLIGNPPEISLGFSYVEASPYEVVMIGSLRVSQLLRFDYPEALRALLEGIPVYLWLPGLEHRQLGPDYAPELYAACLSTERTLSQWGIHLLQDVPNSPLITAKIAKSCREQGMSPPSNARFTPLARDILGGRL